MWETILIWNQNKGPESAALWHISRGCPEVCWSDWLRVAARIPRLSRGTGHAAHLQASQSKHCCSFWGKGTRQHLQYLLQFKGAAVRSGGMKWERCQVGKRRAALAGLLLLPPLLSATRNWGPTATSSSKEGALQQASSVPAMKTCTEKSWLCCSPARPCLAVAAAPTWPINYPDPVCSFRRKPCEHLVAHHRANRASPYTEGKMLG